MAKARSRPDKSERLTGYTVLAALAAVAVWVLASQARFNPAVIVAMNHPKGAGRIVTGQRQDATVTAAHLTGLTGFAALSPVESYGPETLSDKIDGKAELYLASGFQEMSCGSFAAGDAGGARVEVFLYAMESPKDAFAVFSGQRRPGADQLSLSPNSYATGNAVFLTGGRFYLELIADKASPELRPALESMAQAILDSLPRDGAASSDSGLFPAKGLKTDTVRLAVSDALGMQGLENVYTADYDVDGATAGAFLAVRATPEEARARADAYAAFLEANGFKKVKPEGAPDGAVVMAFDNMAQVVMAKGRVFTGVHDAADMAAALKLAAVLDASLGGNKR